LVSHIAAGTEAQGVWEYGRTTFGPKKQERTEDRRTLDNEELHDLYSSPYSRPIQVIKLRRNTCVEYVTPTEGEKGKPERKRPLGG
jgi:hypothetical protein